MLAPVRLRRTQSLLYLSIILSEYNLHMTPLTTHHYSKKGRRLISLGSLVCPIVYAQIFFFEIYLEHKLRDVIPSVTTHETCAINMKLT